MLLTFLCNIFQRKIRFAAPLTAFVFACVLGGWLCRVKIVDPVHHKLYLRQVGTAGFCFLLITAAVILYIFRRYKASPGAVGLCCAAGAAVLLLFPGFTALSASLFLLTLALWRSFPYRHSFNNDSRWWICVPAGLFAYIFICGLEQQYQAYNKLLFLYNDWGIYFDHCRKLAEQPLSGWGAWCSAGNHWNPAVNLVVAAVLSLFPGAATLFAINSLVLASSVPLTWCLGKCLKLSNSLCALCTVAAAFHPLFSNQHTALIYGYHPVVFLLPAALLFCIAKEKKSLPGMILAGIFLCGIKETVFIFTFGSALIFACRKQWKTAVLTGGVSLALFYLVTQILLPRCDGTGKFFQMFQYQTLGNSMGEIMLSPFRSPEIFFGKFFNSGNLSFVLLLLLPFVPLALFAPEFLLAALPLLCGILLKDHYEDKVNIVQQYGFEITVLLLLAFLYGASRVRQKRKLTCGMAAAVLTGCLAGYYFVGKTPVFGTYSATPARKSPDVRVIREQLKKLIPSDAVVAVSQKWAAQLIESHRNIRLDIAAEDAAFRVLDFSDSFLPAEAVMRLRDRLRLEQTEHPVGMFNLRGCRILVFKKGKGSWNLPFIVSGTPAELAPGGVPVQLAEPELTARAVLLADKRKILLFCGVLAETDYDTELSICLNNSNLKQMFNINWGYGLYPTYAMTAKQCFVIELPVPQNWERITGLTVNIKKHKKPSIEKKNEIHRP